MEQPIEFRKIREFGEVIGDTFLFIKQNFKPLMKAIIYLCGLFLVASTLSSIIAQLQIVGLVNDASGSNIDVDNPMRMFYRLGFSYFIVIAFLLLSYMSFYVTILSYIAVYIEKGNIAPTIEEVWAYFKYYFFRLLGSGIAMTLFMGLCFICCIIPGIWVFPAVTIFYPIMVMENAGFSYAFNRSFKLINNEWWITFATLVVIYIIAQACTFVIQLPALIIAWASAFTHLQQPITKTYAIVTSLAQSIGQLVVIIPTIGATFIYFNLVERKESTGLMDKIENFGENTNTSQTAPEEY